MNETPSTELDAVNAMLTDIGEAPISSLEDDLPLDAVKAKEVLHRVSRYTQTRGWFWNMETMTLVPNEDNEIQLPANVIDVNSTNRRKTFTVRDGLIYRIERNNNGRIFSTPEEVELTFFLTYDELPEIAKTYVSLRAVRSFQVSDLGDELSLRNATFEEQQAWSQLKAEDNRMKRRSLRQANGVRRITDRQVIHGPFYP